MSDIVVERANIRTWGMFGAAFLLNVDADHSSLRRMDFRLRSQSVRYRRCETAFHTIIAPGAIRGYVHCAMAHASVLRTAKYEGTEPVLVFEDDAILRDDTAEFMWSSIVPQLRLVEWDILFLGPDVCGESDPLSANLLRVRRGCQMHAYAVSTRGLDRVLRILDQAIVAQRAPCDVMVGNDSALIKVRTSPTLAMGDPA